MSRYEPTIKRAHEHGRKVTPFPQFVATQAVSNIVTGKYRVIPDSVKKYVLGWYGDPLGEISDELIRAVKSSGDLPRKSEPLSLAGLEQDVVLTQDRSERENWPAMRERISQVFLAHDRAWWSARSRDPSGCVNVVRELSEIRELPQVVERRSLVEISGVWQAAPTPRFSRTGSASPRPARGGLQQARGGLRTRIQSSRT